MEDIHDIPHYKELIAIENKVKNFCNNCRKNCKQIQHLDRNARSELLTDINREALEIKYEIQKIDKWICEPLLLLPTEIIMFQNISRKLKYDHNYSLSLITVYQNNESCFLSLTFDDDIIYEQNLINKRKQDTSILDNIYIRDVHKEIHDLEKDVVSLQQMFIDTANIIDSQDKQLQPIAIDFHDANINTDKILDVLQESDNYAIKIRKRKIKIVVLVVASVGVIITIIASIGALCAAALGLFA